MSTAAPARTWATTALRYLPGLLLLLVVGVVGTFAQTGLRSVATATGTRLPDVEYVLWAIVIGLGQSATRSACPRSSGPASGPTSSG